MYLSLYDDVDVMCYKFRSCLPPILCGCFENYKDGVIKATNELLNYLKEKRFRLYEIEVRVVDYNSFMFACSIANYLKSFGKNLHIKRYNFTLRKSSNGVEYNKIHLSLYDGNKNCPKNYEFKDSLHVLLTGCFGDDERHLGIWLAGNTFLDFCNNAGLSVSSIEMHVSDSESYVFACDIKYRFRPGRPLDFKIVKRRF